MNIQRVLLRVMLASLAVAAVVGALSALTMRTDLHWRIIGTCGITAIAAGLLIPLSRQLDKDRSRPAALTAVAGVVIEFLFILALIWDLLDVVVTTHSGEQTITALLFPVAAGVAAILVYLLGGRATKWAGMCGLVLDAAWFAVAMFAVWSNGSGTFTENCAGTAGVIAIFGAMAVACLIGSEGGDRRWWRWIGVAAAAVAMGMNVYAIWHNLNHPSTLFTVIDTVPALVAFANLVLLAPLRSNQFWVQYLAIVTAAITATCEDIEFIQNSTNSIYNADLMSRIASAGGIITGCAAVAVAVLTALNRKGKPKPIATDAIRSITAICPLCQKKLTLPLGSFGQCTCGLKMSVQLEEPHCAECGYLLIGLTSDRCPECGTAINSAVQLQGS